MEMVYSAINLPMMAPLDNPLLPGRRSQVPASGCRPKASARREAKAISPTVANNSMISAGTKHFLSLTNNSSDPRKSRPVRFCHGAFLVHPLQSFPKTTVMEIPLFVPGYQPWQISNSISKLSREMYLSI